MKILIVDDNDVLAHVIQVILEDEGYEVRSAGDGQEGYFSYLHFRPDVVITDLNMPEKNGLEILKAIRADNKTLLTSRPGVFAAGDVITGPKTVIEAIAAGKKAAVMIDRYLHQSILEQPAQPRRPQIYVEPWELTVGEIESSKRAETPRAPAEWRRRNFAEVEVSLPLEESRREARRCLRCDLEFTRIETSKVQVEEMKEEEVYG